MIEAIFEWCNNNSGALSLILFLLTLVMGYVTGIFKNLMSKPDLKITVKPGPSLCCTVTAGKLHNKHTVHRTAISLYLEIKNVGSAPTSIENIHAAYHWFLRPISIDWLKHRLGWYWIKSPVSTLDDFQYQLCEDRVKVYPSLFQGTFLTSQESDTYLPIGKNSSGVVYFEGDEGWGGNLPFIYKKKYTKVRILVKDVYGNKYYTIAKIPYVPLDEARKFNPSYGQTLAQINEQEKLENFDVFSEIDRLNLTKHE